MCASWNSRLRDAWLRSGMQQKRLAELAGVPTSSLSRMLSTDLSNPNVEINSVVPVVRALGLTMSDVFDEAGELPEMNVTPYDRDSDIREVVDLVESLPSAEKYEILHFIRYVVRKVRAAAERHVQSGEYTGIEREPTRDERAVHRSQRDEGTVPRIPRIRRGEEGER